MFHNFQGCSCTRKQLCKTYSFCSHQLIKIELFNWFLSYFVLSCLTNAVIGYENELYEAL